jgi:hypothetical protein
LGLSSSSSPNHLFLSPVIRKKERKHQPKKGFLNNYSHSLLPVQEKEALLILSSLSLSLSLFLGPACITLWLFSSYRAGIETKAPLTKTTSSVKQKALLVSIVEG